MPDARVSGHLELARDLERRDAEMAGRIGGVAALLRNVDALRARATELQARLEEIPGEIRQAEADERDARVRAAATHEEVAEAERQFEDVRRSRRSGADAKERASRAVLRAEIAAADATTNVMRARSRIEDAIRTEAVLQSEAEGLVVEARVIAQALAQEPRLSDSGRSLPGSSLAEIDEWGARAHAALFLVRGGLENERERLVLEANSLAAAVLIEHAGGASVELVRRRLEEALDDGTPASG